MADEAVVDFCAEVHEDTGVAKGNVEGGPDVEPCQSFDRGGQKCQVDERCYL